MPRRWDPRNGHRSKIVLTEIGPVEIDVRRACGGSFEPKIVAKLKRRHSGVEIARRHHLAAISVPSIGRLARTSTPRPAAATPAPAVFG